MCCTACIMHVFTCSTPSSLQLPEDSSLSEECKDLLSKLLQRNPSDRISFEDFFAHPFVDLDKKHSKEYFRSGVSVRDWVEGVCACLRIHRVGVCWCV